jgi:hypothetical protein
MVGHMARFVVSVIETELLVFGSFEGIVDKRHFVL